MANDDINAALGGVVIRPGDPDWDAARRFHSGIGEPALVIRAASVNDVRSAVRYAAAEGLEVLVRSGATAPGAPCPAASLLISRRSPTSRWRARG
ncbi:hypothetical protein ACH0AH_04900 [Microbacterium paludicola]|uniref:hypothetical protein n=1 Tax=Microbacterium paludicola TaxID=300019 RepID=UPI003879411B